MFFSEQRTVTTSISAAQVRLGELIDDGWLSLASEHAYRDGLDHLVWPGPAGSMPGAPRLAAVRYTASANQNRLVIRGMRWEITAAAGLFPALDANIILDAHGQDAIWATLTGVYRLPLGPPDSGLRRALLRTVTTATVQSLMTRLSTVLQTKPPSGIPASEDGPVGRG
jgi:hypothetical protein